mgnify:FL=1|jgi:hypothetical protein
MRQGMVFLLVLMIINTNNVLFISLSCNIKYAKRKFCTFCRGGNNFQIYFLVLASTCIIHIKYVSCIVQGNRGRKISLSN